MTDYRLDTPTKGVAVGIFADEWTMVEKNLPIDMGLYPWSPSNANPILSSNAIAAIKCAAQTEVEEDMHEQVSLDSLYFSGKGFAKWAMMACALDLADLHELRDICVEKLKEEFSLFARNQHTNPLQYDETFGGIVLEAGLKNPMMDFGNALYNYHHFHYGKQTCPFPNELLELTTSLPSHRVLCLRCCSIGDLRSSGAVRWMGQFLGRDASP